MRKKIGVTGIILVVYFLFFPLVSSISSNIKEVYESRETMIVEISGNILEPIDKGQIEFKRGHVRIPLEYDVRKIDERYYLWAVAPENENNYSLIISNLSTTVNGQIQKIDFVENFSVIGNLTDYSIKPGFVFTSEDFRITAVLNVDEDKTISANFPVERDIVLKPGENVIEFSVNNVLGKQFLIISIGKYNVPAYILGKEANITRNESYPYIKFHPGKLENVVLLSEKPIFNFYVVNLGNKNIEDAYFDYNKDLFIINPNEKINLKSGEVAGINLSFKSGLKTNVSESINLKYGNYSSEFLVNIGVTSNINQSNYLNGTGNRSSLFLCTDLSGKTCKENEICSVNEIPSADGNCCIGNCISSKGGSKSWIGYLIAGIVLVGLAFLYLRYKKILPEKNPLKKQVDQIEGKMP